MIVAIEGHDAVGKATQSRLLAQKLGGEVVSFPDYGTRTGEAILAHLKNQWWCHEPTNAISDFDALAFQCLMTVNRLELAPRVRALVEARRHIIFDRYYASAIVYGSLDGLDRAWLEQTQSVLAEPDVWILIDVPPEESVRRRPERRDRYEANASFMAQVREHYLYLFAEKLRSGKPWHVIDGRGSVEETHGKICALVDLYARPNYRTT